MMTVSFRIAVARPSSALLRPAFFLQALLLPALWIGAPAVCDAAPGQAGGARESAILTLFGKSCLKGVDVVVEADVIRVSAAGMGTELVRLKAVKFLHDHLSKRERERAALVVFSNRGEYIEGTRSLLFLSRFGTGRMYTTARRLAPTDPVYKEKVDLIGEYLRIEEIGKRAERRKALKALLLGRLDDDSLWVRRNVLDELENLVRDEKARFTREDSLTVKGADRKDCPSKYKKRLDALGEAIAERVKKDKQNRRQDNAGTPDRDGASPSRDSDSR